MQLHLDATFFMWRHEGAYLWKWNRGRILDELCNANRWKGPLLYIYIYIYIYNWVPGLGELMAHSSPAWGWQGAIPHGEISSHPFRRPCGSTDYPGRAFLPKKKPLREHGLAEESFFAEKKNLREHWLAEESFFAEKKAPAGAQISLGELLWIPYGSIQEDMSSCWRRRHVFLFNKKTFRLFGPKTDWIGSIWLLTGWCLARLKQNTSTKLFKLFPGLWDII